MSILLGTIYLLMMYLSLPFITCFVDISDIAASPLISTIVNRMQLYKCMGSAEIMVIFPILAFLIGGFIAFKLKLKKEKRNAEVSFLSFSSTKILIKLIPISTGIEVIYKVIKLIIFGANDPLSYSRHLFSGTNSALAYFFSSSTIILFAAVGSGVLFGTQLALKRNMIQVQIIPKINSNIWSLAFYISVAYFTFLILICDSVYRWSLLFGSFFITYFLVNSYIRNKRSELNLKNFIKLIIPAFAMFLFLLSFNLGTGWFISYRINQSYVLQRVLNNPKPFESGSLGDAIKTFSGKDPNKALEGNATGSNLGVIQETDNKTGTAITLPGDAYLFGGTIFTTLFFFIIGFSMGLFEKFIITSKKLDVISLTFFCWITLRLILSFESPVMVSLNWILQSIIFWMIIKFVIINTTSNKKGYLSND